MTNRFMARLEKAGVPTHFVEELSQRETVVKKVSLVQQGVPQIVVFIGELDGGRVEDDALLHAVERTPPYRRKSDPFPINFYLT
mgnify:CR=1 FL=1